MRPDGLFAPTSGSLGSADSLYDVILRPSTPWPHTAEAHDPDAPAYAAAMAYITCQLTNSTLSTYSPDVRTAYLAGPKISWSAALDELEKITYPGARWDCPSGTPAPLPTNQTFTSDQFATLKDELENEFQWIADTYVFFDTIRDAFAFSGDKTGQSVQSIGEAISTAVEPPDTEILSSVLFLLESIAEVGEVFEVADEGVAAGIGLLASSYDLGTGIASSVSGTPVGQQITAKADAFATEVQANVASAEEALDGIRAVAISDYGRLQAIRQLNAATNPTSTDLEKRLTAGASSYFRLRADTGDIPALPGEVRPARCRPPAR